MIFSIQTFWREKANAFLCAFIAIVLVVSAPISISANASSPQVEGIAAAGSQISKNQALLDQTLENVDCDEIVIREDCCDGKGEQPCPDSSDCKTVCANTNIQLPTIQYQNDDLRYEQSGLKIAPDTAIHNGISPHLTAPPPRD